MSTWSLQWRWNSHQSKALVSGDTYKQCTVMHCKYAFWAWGFSRKKCQFNVNWDVKIGGVSLWCNYIMWGGGRGAVDCPGPRWIGCRIKGSPILTTRAQSHTCKGQRKEIPPLLYWKVSNQRLLGRFHVYGTSLDPNVCLQECCYFMLLLLKHHHHIDYWSPRHHQNLTSAAKSSLFV